MQKILDKIGWKTEWIINKFRDPNDEIAKMLRLGAKIEDVTKQFPEAFIGEEVIEGNVALNVGLQYLIDCICGIGTTTKWDNTNARLGVGSDATAADATQTDLIDTTPTWKAMDATYPQRSNQTAEWRSTFGTGDANEAWNEFAVDNGASAHKLLNRKVESKGTKASGETWTLSLKITFS
jgi:hypothetical protein